MRTAKIPRPQLKKLCAQEFARAIEAELERFVGPGCAARLDFEALEIYLRSKALEFVGQLLEQHLNRDGSDWSGPHQPCPCGAQARYAGRSAKTVTTLLGPLQLQRAYYHCSACGQGFFPRDRSLGLDRSSLSPGVLRMTGRTASLVSFAEASELLADLAKHVERAAEALGREIAAAERSGKAFADEPPAAPTMYLGVDGTGVPVRKGETAGRPGKQPDGSAKTREAKLALVWTAQSRHPKTGHPQRDPGSVTCSGAIESAASRDTDPQPSAFAQRVRREAERRGFVRAGRRVVLGDGAAWIWALCQEQFPGAIQIVDLWHAKEHLWDVAKQLHRGNPAGIEAWAEARCDDLEAGRLAAVLQALRSASGCEAALKCAQYMERNRHRMRYADFRAAGLCVGSGVVESGCKTIVGTRFKRSGMHWTVAGANAILSLRCCISSGRFEDYWAYRSTSS